MVLWHLKQIGKVTKLKSGCLMSWPEIKTKKSSFWSVVFSYSMHQQQTILYQIVMCNKKWTLYHNRQLLAQWLDWEEASKHFPELNLHLKMIMVTVWWSAACLIHYSFLNPSKTGEVCSANQWDALKTPTPAASIGQRKGPSSSLWKCGPHVITHNWVMKFCLICYIHLTSRQLITISSIISTTSCRENTSQPAWDRKCFPRVHWIQNHEYWHYRNKQTYFSMAESVDCSGSYFD